MENAILQTKDQWVSIEDPESGQTYYYNELTGETQWEAPSTLKRDDALLEMSSEQQISNYQGPERVDDWQEYDDGEGNLYYYNALTGESTWERPTTLREADPQQLTATALTTPAVTDVWEELKDSDGNSYYYNSVTGESQWDPPGGGDTAASTAITDIESSSTQEWEAFDDGFGNKYYYNNATGVSQWEPPPELEADKDGFTANLSSQLEDGQTSVLTEPNYDATIASTKKEAPTFSPSVIQDGSIATEEVIINWEEDSSWKVTDFMVKRALEEYNAIVEADETKADEHFVGGSSDDDSERERGKATGLEGLELDLSDNEAKVDEDAEVEEKAQTQPLVKSLRPIDPFNIAPWVQAKDEEGATYYYNPETMDTSWDVPDHAWKKKLKGLQKLTPRDKGDTSPLTRLKAEYGLVNLEGFEWREDAKERRNRLRLEYTRKKNKEEEARRRKINPTDEEVIEDAMEDLISSVENEFERAAKRKRHRERKAIRSQYHTCAYGYTMKRMAERKPKETYLPVFGKEPKKPDKTLQIGAELLLKQGTSLTEATETVTQLEKFRLFTDVEYTDMRITEAGECTPWILRPSWLGPVPLEELYDEVRRGDRIKRIDSAATSRMDVNEAEGANELEMDADESIVSNLSLPVLFGEVRVHLKDYKQKVHIVKDGISKKVSKLRSEVTKERMRARKEVMFEKLHHLRDFDAKSTAKSVIAKDYRQSLRNLGQSMTNFILKRESVGEIDGPRLPVEFARFTLALALIAPPPFERKEIKDKEHGGKKIFLDTSARKDFELSLRKDVAFAADIKECFVVIEEITTKEPLIKQGSRIRERPEVARLGLPLHHDPLLQQLPGAEEEKPSQPTSPEEMHKGEDGAKLSNDPFKKEQPRLQSKSLDLGKKAGAEMKPHMPRHQNLLKRRPPLPAPIPKPPRSLSEGDSNDDLENSAIIEEQPQPRHLPLKPTPGSIQRKQAGQLPLKSTPGSVGSKKTVDKRLAQSSQDTLDSMQSIREAFQEEQKKEKQEAGEDKDAVSGDPGNEVMKTTTADENMIDAEAVENDTEFRPDSSASKASSNTKEIDENEYQKFQKSEGKDLSPLVSNDITQSKIAPTKTESGTQAPQLSSNTAGFTKTESEMPPFPEVSNDHPALVDNKATQPGLDQNMLSSSEILAQKEKEQPGSPDTLQTTLLANPQEPLLNPPNQGDKQDGMAPLEEGRKPDIKIGFNEVLKGNREALPGGMHLTRMELAEEAFRNLEYKMEDLYKEKVKQHPLYQKAVEKVYGPQDVEYKFDDWHDKIKLNQPLVTLPSLKLVYGELKREQVYRKYAKLFDENARLFVTFTITSPIQEPGPVPVWERLGWIDVANTVIKLVDQVADSESMLLSGALTSQAVAGWTSRFSVRGETFTDWDSYWVHVLHPTFFGYETRKLKWALPVEASLAPGTNRHKLKPGMYRKPKPATLEDALEEQYREAEEEFQELAKMFGSKLKDPTVLTPEMAEAKRKRDAAYAQYKIQVQKAKRRHEERKARAKKRRKRQKMKQLKAMGKEYKTVEERQALKYVDRETIEMWTAEAEAVQNKERHMKNVTKAKAAKERRIKTFYKNRKNKLKNWLLTKLYSYNPHADQLMEAMQLSEQKERKEDEEYIVKEVTADEMRRWNLKKAKKAQQVKDEDKKLREVFRMIMQSTKGDGKLLKKKDLMRAMLNDLKVKEKVETSRALRPVLTLPEFSQAFLFQPCQNHGMLCEEEFVVFCLLSMETSGRYLAVKKAMEKQKERKEESKVERRLRKRQAKERRAKRDADKILRAQGVDPHKKVKKVDPEPWLRSHHHILISVRGGPLYCCLCRQRHFDFHAKQRLKVEKDWRKDWDSHLDAMLQETAVQAKEYTEKLFLDRKTRDVSACQKKTIKRHMDFILDTVVHRETEGTSVLDIMEGMVHKVELTGVNLLSIDTVSRSDTWGNDPLSDLPGFGDTHVPFLEIDDISDDEKETPGRLSQSVPSSPSIISGLRKASKSFTAITGRLSTQTNTRRSSLTGPSPNSPQSPQRAATAPSSPFGKRSVFSMSFKGSPADPASPSADPSPQKSPSLLSKLGSRKASQLFALGTKGSEGAMSPGKLEKGRSSLKLLKGLSKKSPSIFGLRKRAMSEQSDKLSDSQDIEPRSPILSPKDHRLLGYKIQAIRCFLALQAQSREKTRLAVRAELEKRVQYIENEERERRGMFQEEEHQRKVMESQKRRTERPFRDYQERGHRAYSTLLANCQAPHPTLRRLQWERSLTKDDPRNIIAQVQDPANRKRYIIYVIPCLTEEDQAYAVNEAYGVQDFPHACLVKIHHTFTHQVRAFNDLGYNYENWTMVAVLVEHCSGGRMLDQIRLRSLARRNEESTKLLYQWFQQISSGLRHLHSIHAVHRNLNPGNIYLDERGRAKIGSYAWLKDSRGPNSAGSAGLSDFKTLRYMPPEIEEDQAISKPSDVWALGCCLYYWATGQDIPPLSRRSVEQLIHNIPIHMQKKIGDALRMCLQTDPNVRASAQELFNYLSMTQK